MLSNEISYGGGGGCCVASYQMDRNPPDQTLLHVEPRWAVSVSSDHRIGGNRLPAGN